MTNICILMKNTAIFSDLGTCIYPVGLTREGCRDVRGELGRGKGENPRGGAKERVNQLIQKFAKSAYIVIEIFVVYNYVLINENIISSHF